MTSGEESLAKGGESKATDPVQERSDVQNVSDSHQHKKRMMEPGQPTYNESIKNEHNDVQDHTMQEEPHIETQKETHEKEDIHQKDIKESDNIQTEQPYRDAKDPNTSKDAHTEEPQVQHSQNIEPHNQNLEQSINEPNQNHSPSQSSTKQGPNTQVSSLYIEPGNTNCWLFLEQYFLLKSPSRSLLKMSVPQELKVREGIHDFIIRLGTRLKLDGRTILAATVYVNRYYMRMPISLSKYYVASAAVAILTKLNDTYRQPDKIALQACNLKNPHPSKPVDEQSDMFWRWRDQLLYREELILKTLNFDLNIELPYTIREDLVEVNTAPTPSGFFEDKKEEILKNTISLIEILSSLPILVAYDMPTLFGTMLVVVMYEAKGKFAKEVSLPKGFLDVVQTSSQRCLACYKYIIKLLKYAAQDPLVVSNKLASKRLSPIDDEVFTRIANGLE